MSRRAELSPQNSFREQGDCRPAHPRAPGRRPAHFPAREHAAPAADQRCAAQQSRSALQAAGCTARAPHPYTHMSYVAASHALAPAASFARRCRIRHSHPCIRAHSCAACWPCPCWHRHKPRPHAPALVSAQLGRFVSLETPREGLPEGPSQELAFFWRATAQRACDDEYRRSQKRPACPNARQTSPSCPTHLYVSSLLFSSLSAMRRRRLRLCTMVGTQNAQGCLHHARRRGQRLARRH